MLCPKRQLEAIHWITQPLCQSTDPDFPQRSFHSSYYINNLSIMFGQGLFLASVIIAALTKLYPTDMSTAGKERLHMDGSF